MVAQLGGGAGEGDFPGLQDIGAVGDLQGQVGVLLHQEDGGPLLVDALNHPEDLPHQQRGQAHGRLIQQQELRPAHQGPAHRQHLLLAAGQGVAPLAAPLLEAREEGEDLLQVALNVTIPAHVGRQAQIFQDRQVAEDAPAFRDQGHAPLHPQVRRQLAQLLPGKGNPAPGHGQEPRDGLQDAGFAGAVGPDEGDDLALPHGERDPAHRADAVVGDPEVFDVQ